MKIRDVFVSFTLGLSLALALSWVLSAGSEPVAAAPAVPDVFEAPTVEFHVCVTCPYTTVQAAVDAASAEDAIKVATGVYTGVVARPVPYSYDYPPASGLITQAVFVDKSVSIRGGYTTTNWTTSDPLANPTTLDAQGQGRVLCISGDIDVTIEGLILTRGNDAGLGGYPWADYTGGSGVYVKNARVQLLSNVITHNISTSPTVDHGGGIFGRYIGTGSLIKDNLIAGNAANRGGGIFFYPSDHVALVGNMITSNTASYSGGGLSLWYNDATLTGNTVTSNTAARFGGGMDFWKGDVTFSGNTVAYNTAGNFGGGLSLWYIDATLTGNTIAYNTADHDGGGLDLLVSDATLTGNRIVFNTAGDDGGGLDMLESAPTLINNVIADNQADSGSGLFVLASSPRLLHTTLARNTGGDGTGIYVTQNGPGEYSMLAMTNTIVARHTLGVKVTSGSTATIDGVLWGGNNANTSGPGIIVVNQAHSGDPAFAADGYHLTVNSAAIDRGVDAGVATDIDGDPRSDGESDLGADEFPPALQVVKHASPDPVAAGSQLTYTIRVTNTGAVNLHAVITDTLPEDIAAGETSGGTLIVPGGQITWTPIITAPGGVWVETFAVTVDVGYVGLLTDVVQVATREGATGTHTCVVAAEVPISGLNVANDGPTPLGSGSTLSATIAAGSNVSYTWDLGDGSGGTGRTIFHVYAHAGLFRAVVTASNSVSVITGTTVPAISTRMTVSPTGSGTLIYTDTRGLSSTVHVPVGAVNVTTVFTLTPLVTPTWPFSPGLYYAGHAFDLDAACFPAPPPPPIPNVYLPVILRNSGGSRLRVSSSERPVLSGWSPVTATLPCSPTFQTPVTVTIRYGDADAAGLDEDSLRLYYWTGAYWEDDANTCVPASTYVTDTLNNVLVVPVCHSSRHALAGR